MLLEHEGLTARIIGAAIEVHKALGPGLLEVSAMDAVPYDALLPEHRRSTLDPLRAAVDQALNLLGKPERFEAQADHPVNNVALVIPATARVSFFSWIPGLLRGFLLQARVEIMHQPGSGPTLQA